MGTKPELTPAETLMQEIGLALLKYTGYEIGAVNVVDTTTVDVVVETGDDTTDDAPKAKTRKPATKAKSKAPVEEPEDDGDEDEEGDSEVTREDLEKKTVRQLRNIAIGMGFPADEVKDANKETLVESILNPEDDDEDEDEDEVAESEGVDTEALTSELEKLGLNALKKRAREEFGFTASDYKGMDKDAIIDLVVEKVSDSDIEDDEEEEEPYTEEELDDMSMAELKAICKEWGIKIRVGEKKPAHIEAILEAQEEEGED